MWKIIKYIGDFYHFSTSASKLKNLTINHLKAIDSNKIEVLKKSIRTITPAWPFRQASKVPPYGWLRRSLLAVG